MAKKKKSFQQEIKEKRQLEEHQITKPVTAIFDPGHLDSKTRTGLILMSYFLFLVGSIGALIMGYSGRDRPGSTEVIIIAWVAFISHLLFLMLLLTNMNPSPFILPIMPFVILALIPIVCIIAGFTAKNMYWSEVVKSIGMLIIIPQFLVLGISYTKIAWDENQRREIRVRNSINTVMYALDNYGYENESNYPKDISILVDKGYLKSFPLNPFSESGETMKNVDFWAGLSPGDFTYFPFEEKGKVAGYYLIGYGTGETVLKSGREYYIDVDGDGEHDSVVAVVGSSSEGLSNVAPLTKILQESAQK